MSRRGKEQEEGKEEEPSRGGVSPGRGVIDPRAPVSSDGIGVHFGGASSSAKWTSSQRWRHCDPFLTRLEAERAREKREQDLRRHLRPSGRVREEAMASLRVVSHSPPPVARRRRRGGPSRPHHQNDANRAFPFIENSRIAGLLQEARREVFGRAGGKKEEEGQEQALRTQRLVPRRGRKHQGGGEGDPSLLPDGEPGVHFTRRGLKSRDRMPYRRREALRSMSVQPTPRPNQQGGELDAVVLKKRLDKYSLGLHRRSPEGEPIDVHLWIYYWVHQACEVLEREGKSRLPAPVHSLQRPTGEVFISEEENGVTEEQALEMAMEWESLSIRRYRERLSPRHKAPRSPDLLNTASLLTQQQCEALDELSLGSLREHCGFVSSLGTGSTSDGSAAMILDQAPGPMGGGFLPLDGPFHHHQHQHQHQHQHRAGASPPPPAGAAPEAPPLGEEAQSLCPTTSRDKEEQEDGDKLGEKEGGVLILTLPTDTRAIGRRSVEPTSSRARQVRVALGEEQEGWVTTTTTTTSTEAAGGGGDSSSRAPMLKSRSLGSLNSWSCVGSPKGTWSPCSPLERQRSLESVGVAKPRRRQGERTGEQQGV